MLKRLLKQQLWVSVILLKNRSSTISNNTQLVFFTPEKVSWRIDYKNGLVYRCAIAFPLAARLKISPLEVAQQLIEFLPNLTNLPNNQLPLEVDVQIVPPGWLDFHLSDRTLAQWLEQILLTSNQERQIQGNGTGKSGLNLFPIQYTHARCCSLLRLAQQEGLIQLKPPQLHSSTWQWLEPNPIPWLTKKTKTFLFCHTDEQNLLKKLLLVSDALWEDREPNWGKLAFNLSVAIMDFSSSCRIWGEVKNHHPQLAQARLALIAVCQVLLRQILQEKLSTLAPLEM